MPNKVKDKRKRKLVPKASQPKSTKQTVKYAKDNWGTNKSIGSPLKAGFISVVGKALGVLPKKQGYDGMTGASPQKTTHKKSTSAKKKKSSKKK